MSTRTHLSSIALVVGLILVLPASGSAQASLIPVTGRTLQVRLLSGGDVSGELLEALHGRLLLRTPGSDREFNLQEVRSVRYQRHQWTTQKALTWVAIGAAVSGAGLTMACSSLENAECGGVFAGVAVSWAVVGGLLAVALGGSAWQDLPIFNDALRTYARFPQGAPEGFRRH